MEAMATAAALGIARSAGAGLLKKVGHKAKGCNYEVVVDFEISNLTDTEMYLINSFTNDGCMGVPPINVPSKGLMEFTARKTSMSLYGSKGCVEWAYKDYKIRMLWNVQLKTAITGQVRNFLALYIKDGDTWYGNQKEGDQTCIIHHAGILINGLVPNHNHATIKVQISEPTDFNFRVPMTETRRDPVLHENFLIPELGL